MKQVRVNIKALANSALIRKEKLNGRDVIIVPSATLPDNIIMNGVKYPPEEIEKSFSQLERSPAPLGHPKLNGKFVSASDPEGLNRSYIGAWNQNVRRENGRVFMDKVIDVEIANQSEGGKRVLKAIEAGDPVHTSTGLLAMLENVKADDHDFVARGMVFDHDCLLLDEKGAATPEQGVGIFVNSAGSETEVINSEITECLDREIDFAGSRLVEALQRRKNAGVWEKIKTSILEVLGTADREQSVEKKDTELTVTKEQFDALAAKVDAMGEGISGIGNSIKEVVESAVKPLTTANEAAEAKAKAEKDEAKGAYVEEVVKANLLTKAVAETLSIEALKELAKSAKPAKAAAMNSRFTPSTVELAFKAPEGD